MIRVKNERVVFSLYEKGKLKKEIDLKNRLTDLYLDYITYQMLPSIISNEIYSGSPYDNVDDTFYPFSTAYLKFNTTQTIADTDTTMSYDVYDYDTSSLRTTIKVGENSKTMVTNYAFDLSTIADNSLFAGVGFGRLVNDEANYLFSYIDLSGAGIRKTADTSFTITRYDEIQTNEILYSGSIADYLPFKNNLIQSGKLESIITCFGENGTGYEIEYNIAKLVFRRLSAGVIEVSGFDNFYIDDIENDYPQNDYPQNDYPHQPGKIKSVKFKYLLDDDTYIYTYINIEDLDITYNDTEFKMKLICERGNY